ncbi:AAA family ATPase [Marinobacter sp. ELB17]|uniref:AAA family ATPase n=1 Tax=Marinobacter sp. ELB17 TaxID=270374 RepID=UPI0002D95BBA|nr:AAA family ATPase [Marinobacter sp. ELB17]
MSNTLTEIAKKLSTPETDLMMVKLSGKKKKRNNTQVKNAKPIPKMQLIYAFNGSGKTRLSREFKQVVAPKEGEEAELSRNKILYYNAFTEDLFYWDNDLEGDAEPKLKIQPNSFTDWILRDRGQDRNIIENFQRYTDDKLTPTFIEKDKSIHEGGKRVVTKTFPEVVFSYDRGTERTGSIKISKGEESNFVWSVFYTLLEEVTSILDEPDPSKRDDNQFDKLEYVFIDDPVSSLDDSHLIELAVDLAGLVKSSKSDLKFFITTHSPLFYNVLCNELSNKAHEKQPDETYKLTYNPNKEFKKYRLEKKADGLFQMIEQPTDSPFSYHLFLLSELQVAIENGQIRKYHFNFIRNILEKMATFLGYNYWPALLPKTAEGKPDPFAKRILNLSSHSAHAGEEVADIEDKDKEKLDVLVKYLIETYDFRNQEAQ